MKISILCSANNHPIYPYLKSWVENNSIDHVIEIVNRVEELSGGNLLFLISCNELVKSFTRQLYDKSLVIHASNLPIGRGWSPHIWQVLEGKKQITVTLLEAGSKVDSGDIWTQKQINIEEHELFDEINEQLFRCELELMDFAILNFDSVQAQVQSSDKATYYPKRTPKDSEINPASSLKDNFNLLRVSDPDRFPAFFYLHGIKYLIKIEKAKG